MHGYDTIDPTRVNPELGGEEGLRRLVAELRRHEMGLIVDIVPNHMAVGQRQCLVDGRAGTRAQQPLRQIFRHRLGAGRPASARQGAVADPRPAIRRGAGRRRDSATRRQCRQRLHPVLRPQISACGRRSHSLRAGFALPHPIRPRRPDATRLHRLLEEQHYRLAWWRTANDEINWRRFFDINELVAVRVEDDEVFEAVHATLFRLYAEGLIDGVRVDHIDGLARPQDYCTQAADAPARTRDASGRSTAPPGPPISLSKKSSPMTKSFRKAGERMGPPATTSWTR